MRKFWKMAGTLGLSLILLAPVGCSDDPRPVQLVSTESETVLNNQNNTLSLYPHSEPMTFAVSGGEGGFLIENSNEAVVSYKFDGRNITIIPESVGEAVITISSKGVRSFELHIEVKFEQVTYRVESLNANIQGDKLTVGDQKQLAEEIKQNTQMKNGSHYSFEYHDKALTEGIINIFPADNSEEKKFGTFTQKRQFTSNGTEYLHTEMFIGNEKDEFFLLLNDSSEIKELWKDVTPDYQGKYPALEKAYVIQVLEKVQADSEGNASK